MHWVENIEDLYDFIALVVLEAPNDFHRSDFLKEDEQLNLERAFADLNRGMTFVGHKIKDADKICALQNLLDQSQAAYQQDKVVVGANLLQDFEELLVKYVRIQGKRPDQP